jgi:hypothetical protein
MNPLHVLLRLRTAVPPAQRSLLLCAAIVAISLLSFYVHLLHESMALGDQMRARQRIFASMGTVNAALKQTRIGEMQARDTVEPVSPRVH